MFNYANKQDLCNKLISPKDAFHSETVCVKYIKFTLALFTISNTLKAKIKVKLLNNNWV